MLTALLAPVNQIIVSCHARVRCDRSEIKLTEWSKAKARETFFLGGGGGRGAVELRSKLFKNGIKNQVS